MQENIKVCSPFITRNGVRKYAKDYGLKAFCWYVSKEKHEAYLAKKALQKQKNEPGNTSDEVANDK